MIMQTGIALAFLAMLCWGFGDFFIQKSTRTIGDWETLFAITFFGSFILLPFVYKDLPTIFASGNFRVVLVCAVILFIAALLDLEALKEGKLAVVEPIWAFEIVASGLMAFVVLGERLNLFQVSIIALLIAGLCMVSFKEKYFSKKFLAEKGIFIALVSALVMGIANFFMGWSARLTSPLVANFFVNVFTMLGTGIYILSTGRTKKAITDVFSHSKLLFTMAISDNAAWVAFAFSMSLAPIGVAVALSESYIIVAVSLGLLVNKEKIQTHQKIGLAISIVAALVLASITG